MLANGEEETALEYWKNSLKVYPQNPYLWYRMGTTYTEIYNRQLQERFQSNHNNLYDEFKADVKPDREQLRQMKEEGKKSTTYENIKQNLFILKSREDCNFPSLESSNASKHKEQTDTTKKKLVSLLENAEQCFQNSIFLFDSRMKNQQENLAKL